MPTPREYVFSYKELAEALVKKADVHEGLWGVVIRFGFGATNVNTAEPPAEETLLPAALATVREIGIQMFDKPNNLTVDAAQVNPQPESKSISKTGRPKQGS